MKKRLLSVFIALCVIAAGCKDEAAQVTFANSPIPILALPALTQAPAASQTPVRAPVKEETPLPEPTPIYANRIQDGVYSIDVSSSSSMFRVTDARLTVKEGSMSVVMTLGGAGYACLYMGAGKQAPKEPDNSCIYFAENEKGAYTYEVPIKALNFETDVAAWSIRKKTWYDRVLVFQSAGIPPACIEAYTDGRYSVAVSLLGGTGRASVVSPTILTIEGGVKTATIVWSSPYYEYMLVDGVLHEPVQYEGNSTFEIPVMLDEDMRISARTIAMSQPHEIDYTLRLDSSTLKSVP
ncbi:MAG: hypothetical protein LBS18_08025 [Clostridiales bacterium]|nr:hypothetical protein [Clostridiales bacterium]